LEKRLVDLADVAYKSVATFAPRFADEGIAFSTTIAQTVVPGDADRLGQIIDNLLSNALRYTDAGGEVVLRVCHADGLAVLEVADTGVGIAPGDLQNVFMRFWRGERSRSRATGGTGVGLAIVHELVRAHEGSVEVDSRPGEGSTFRVSLPTLEVKLRRNGRSASPDLQTPPRR
jgi:signal transduction histidine kinase